MLALDLVLHPAILVIAGVVLGRHIGVPLRRRAQRVVDVFDFGANRVLVSGGGMRLKHGVFPPQRRALIGQRRGVLVRAHRRPEQLIVVRVQHVGVAVLGRAEAGVRRRGGVQQVEVRPQVVGRLVAPRVHGRGRVEGVGLRERAQGVVEVGGDAGAGGVGADVAGLPRGLALPPFGAPVLEPHLDPRLAQV